jgi:hypothetical protein
MSEPLTKLALGLLKMISMGAVNRNIGYLSSVSFASALLVFLDLWFIVNSEGKNTPQRKQP